MKKLTVNEFDRLLKSKRGHRLMALRYAIKEQLKRDWEEFHNTGVMRCWKCIEIYEEELKRLDEKLDRLIDKIIKGG